MLVYQRIPLFQETSTCFFHHEVAVAPSLRGSAGSAAFGVPGAAVGVVAVAAGARKAMKPRAARKAQSEKRCLGFNF